MKKKYSIIIFFIPTFLLASAEIFAAERISGDANREIVSQEESFREKSSELPEKKETTPVIQTTEVQEPAPAQQVQAAIILKKIVLEGNHVFTEQELEKQYASYLNRKVAFSDLKAIADQITTYYRQAGFTLCKAFLPPQEIENGIVSIRIAEGKVREIPVEGNKFFRPPVYQKAIHLRKDRVFQYQRLEADLYSLNQKPDRSAAAYLVPTDQRDLFDLALKTADTFPVHLYYSLANNGTKLTHRERHNVTVYDTNLTGHGDILSSTVSLAEQGALAAGSVAYFYTLERTGTILSFVTNYVKTRLIGHLKETKIEGSFFSVSPGITQSLIRARLMALDVFIGFDFKESETTAEDLRVNFDQVRVLKGGPRWSQRDSGGKTTVSADVNVGIPGFLGGLDALDPNASRSGSGGKFTYYTADLTRLQRLPHSSYVTLKAGGQWTDNKLISPEQFRAGGATSVRGYPESDSAGDSGFNLSAEFNVPAVFLPTTRVPFFKTTWRQATRLVAFLDSAKTFFRNEPNPGTTQVRTLLGTGFGIRFDLDDHISLRSDLGFPIGNKPSDEKRTPQLHFYVRIGW